MSDKDPELKAMTTILKQLESLSSAARGRVLRYIIDKYEGDVPEIDDGVRQ